MDKKLLFTGLLIFLLLISCDNKIADPIPDVYFSIELNIKAETQFFYLNTQDNAMEISARQVGVSYLGYDNNGIIIYNAGSGIFYAFDRTCPNEIPNSVVTSLTSNNIATCPVCKSQYVLPSEGAPANGSVSQYYLKRYKTSYNANTGVLYVYN